MTAETDVSKASEQFYAALNRMANGDPTALAEIWSHGADVTSMHPIGGREVGWDAVRRSWEQVAAIASAGEVVLSGQFIRVSGELAFEIGTEQGTITIAGHKADIVDQRVTNVYRREGGAWKIVHHHTDISPAMLNILKQLQGKA